MINNNPQNDVHAYQSLIKQGKQKGFIQDVHASGNSLVCLFHLLFKAFPLVLYLLDGIFLTFMGNVLHSQLIIITAVIDFWFTKNVAGRLLAGLRWWFDEDENEIEKLKVECRINDEYTHKVTSKLFWTILVGFVIAFAVFTVFSIFKLNVKNFALSGGVFLALAINTYCFIMAARTQGQQVNILSSKLGLDFPKTLMNGSLVVYT